MAACWVLPLAPSAAFAAGDPGAATPEVRASAAVPAPASASAPAPDREGADLVVAGALRADGSGGREQREGGVPVARDTFDYVLTVTNRGPSTARQVRVTDRLPTSLEFVASRDGCAANGRTVTCGPLAALAVGASHRWVITVRLSADYRGDGTDIVNEAVVGAETRDPDALNNTASLTGLEIPPSARVADLSLRKTARLAPGREDVRPGEKFTYVIAVHNQGPGTARQVTVTDRLPSSLVLLSSPDDCAHPGGEDRLVVCPPRERLASGETAEFRITVRAVTGERAHPPGGSCTPIDNVARVTSASVDPDPSDNANARGTTGPGGGRLCLVSDRGEDHHGREDHHGGEHDDGDGHDDGGHEHHGREDHDDGREDHGRDDHHHGQEHHGGRGDLADSGARVPGWLLWVSAALVGGGAALRTAFRARA
ncbi:DUF11 domain-containing protein [Streptomyces sp. NPDC059564]|uniref:DUF11 domain-containing protein n=1 Tax=Streptomyces sp. NPDC059564 TaxID=3346865 RepID=UPI00369EAC3B